MAKSGNISNYENKSKEDLTKAFSKSESKSKPKTKPETKPKPKPKLEPKLEIKINKKKLKVLKDFDELRHKFSNKDEIREYRQHFYDAKRCKLSESKMTKLNKSLNKLKKSLKFKKFHSNIDRVDYEDFDNYDDNYYFADDDKYRKVGSIRKLFQEFDRDYYKPIKTDAGFAGRKNNYIEYKSKGDRYENLSSK